MDTELGIILTKALLQLPEYSEAVQVLNTNSPGKIWLIGGGVYRTLAEMLYGVKAPKVDLDFIIETATEKPVLPMGWQLTVNNFGNYKYQREGLSIDVVPLTNIHSIIENQLEPTIENFLFGTPLTIQSIAYDVVEHNLIGQAGITALQTKTVKVHNYKALQYVCEKYAVTANDYIQSKATSLNFKAE